MDTNKILLGIIALMFVGVIGFVFLSNGSEDDTATNSEQEETLVDKNNDIMEEQIMENNKTIVDIAVESGNFNTLVTALTEAELVETLSSKGPFTVFAPTDEAFAKIPEETLQEILADKEKLTAILTYHVVSGKVMAADVVNLKKATTVQGTDIAISVEDSGEVMINDATVLTTDIEASNGVIHVIDTVILPE